jgi:AcrR family transcriptional regulator
MGIRERKARNRLNMHNEILHAALSIVREEGYRSLSLRRLADNIEYSATVMYLYFENKEVLLIDLAKLGYQQLNASIDRTCKNIVDPKHRLKAMLTTYWHFTINEKELYLLMQEVGMNLNESEPLLPEMRTFVNSINQATTNACEKENYSDAFLKRKSYISIAIVQGLASLNLIHKELHARSQAQMLEEAIDNLINSLN